MHLWFNLALVSCHVLWRSLFQEAIHQKRMSNLWGSPEPWSPAKLQLTHRPMWEEQMLIVSSQSCEWLVMPDNCSKMSSQCLSTYCSLYQEYSSMLTLHPPCASHLDLSALQVGQMLQTTYIYWLHVIQLEHTSKLLWGKGPLCLVHWYIPSTKHMMASTKWI